MEETQVDSIKNALTIQDQYCTLLNLQDAGTSLSPSLTIKNGVKYGSIVITTSSTYNGTTGTIALQGSNDNSNFQAVLQDDNATAMSFTPAASSTYTFLLKAVLFKYYKLVYTKGDASAGTITSNFIGKI